MISNKTDYPKTPDISSLNIMVHVNKYVPSMKQPHTQVKGRKKNEKNRRNEQKKCFLLYRILPLLDLIILTNFVTLYLFLFFIFCF